MLCFLFYRSLEDRCWETAEVVLNIEQAEFETDQINTADDFNVGDLVYWDDSNKQLTTSDGSGANRLVGRVTAAKDENNVIWLLLGPQV